MSLFRKEAISHQSERLTGAITLAQPLSIKLTVLMLVAVAVAIITFLFSAEYSRKATVRGFLMPNKGVIKSFANQGGTIEKLWVSAGQQAVGLIIAAALEGLCLMCSIFINHHALKNIAFLSGVFLRRTY